MTDIYIAYSCSGEARVTFEHLDWEEFPLSLLVSYFYMPAYRRARFHSQPKKKMLDSGAFSAWNSGATIDIDALIAETKKPEWHESVALDVIKSPMGSLRNALKMQQEGSPAFPVFHYGEPWEILTEYCCRFEKVGLSCRFGEKEKDSLRWLDACYARAWPHRFHSFGWVKPDMLKRYPFESADAVSWCLASAVYGRWIGFKSKPLRVRGIIDQRANLQHYCRLQEELRAIWKKELGSIRSTSGSTSRPPQVSST